MVSSTANTNRALDKIANAIADADKQGLVISSGHHGNIFSCISLSVDINKAIDLSKTNAVIKLNALIKLINVKAKAYSSSKKTKSMKDFKVLFLATRSGKQFNFQVDVTAEDESKAKVAGRSELLAEGLNPFLYKAPVVTVVRPAQGAA